MTFHTPTVQQKMSLSIFGRSFLKMNPNGTMHIIFSVLPSCIKGTIYSVTAQTIPFLVKLLTFETVIHRDGILYLLYMFANGYCILQVIITLILNGLMHI